MTLRDRSQAMAYALSHDMREPVRAVCSFSQLLEMRAGDALDERCRRYVGHISSAAKRMNAQLDGLLAYSRIATQYAPRDAVDVGDAARAAVRALGVAPAVRIEKLDTVPGDRSLLEAMLAHLVGNAVTHAGASRISIGAEALTARTRIEVRDDGVGLNDSQVARAFELFSRFGGDGLGLGLAIVDRIAQCHGGVVGVDSVVGRGSTFWVELPRAA